MDPPAAVDPDRRSYDQLLQSLAGYLEVDGYAEMFIAAGFGRAVELARASAARDHVLPQPATRPGSAH